MAIYRGIGGAGDSTTDATVTAVTEQAVDAAQSATEAATSASSAATSAASASLSASDASTSETNASTSETNAAASEANAASSETAAAASAIAADVSANDAATSEANAAASETASAVSAASASASATTATTQATAASASASAAATSETNALASKTNASASETAAAGSATAASGSATAAASSASAASTSETNAANSATAAATSETNAAASATAAAASEAGATADAATATTKAAEASTSATNAAASATTATTKATEAATSAANAAASETNAAASESAAASSQTAAEAAKDAALAALDSFDDRYLGQKVTDPTVDNDGNALVAGALYFNTTDDVMKVYEGSTWVAAYASLSGALLQSNNLSDVLNVAAARTNLGLGTAATTASTDYATAAQGALADSALQSIPDNYVLNTGDSITGNLSFGDNDKAIFGASDDLQIFHDTADSWIQDRGEGNLKLGSNGFGVEIRRKTDSADESLAVFNNNGSVDLYYDNAKKFATTSTGVDVSGTAVSDKVGVGLTTPQKLLDTFETNNATDSVSGIRVVNFSTTNNSRAGIAFQNYDNYGASVWSPRTGGTAGALVFGTNGGAGTAETNISERMRITSTGNVGIGTSSPSENLHIVDSAFATLQIESTGASSDPELLLTNDNGGASEWSLRLDKSNSDIFQIRYNNASKMILDTSGNVGIGTSSPSAKLQVEDSGNVAIKATKSSISSISLDVGTTENAIIWDGSRDLKFMGGSSGTAERMRIDSSGNVGIGTGSPTSTLDVAGTVNATAYSGGNTANWDTAYGWGNHATAGYISDDLLYMRKSANSNLDMNNYNIVDVEDITLQDRIQHDGDTNTYMQFHAEDQWRVVTGGAERLEVNNTNTTVANTFRMNNGYGSAGIVYGCRAWCNFNGSASPPTIRDDGNVSSITDLGTGNYRFNWSTAFPDNDYAVCDNPHGQGDHIFIGGVYSISTTSVSMYFGTTGVWGSKANYRADRANYGIAVFR
jgi:hypothetical protein